MDRNYIVELIKDNRLQEAIKAIEKATKGSHLHNQIIMLSSSYAEYTQLNRSATEDFQTLEIQRAKITNSLLSFLDEVSPEDLANVVLPQRKEHYEPVAEHAESSVAQKMDGIDKKWYLYGAGVLVLLLIVLAVKCSTQEETASPMPAAAQTSVVTPDNTAVTSQNVRLVDVIESEGSATASITYDGTNWIEESTIKKGTNAFHFVFKEVKRDNESVYMRDKNRRISLELNLTSKLVMCTEGNEEPYVLYRITRAQQ